MTSFFRFIAMILPFLYIVGKMIIGVLIILALIKFLCTSSVKKENRKTMQTLGETLKYYRTRANMTQEYVAQTLGVSRQAVSKWENGTSDPSTANLLALAKLFGISASELLESIEY